MSNLLAKPRRRERNLRAHYNDGLVTRNMRSISDILFDDNLTDKQKLEAIAFRVRNALDGRLEK